MPVAERTLALLKHEQQFVNLYRDHLCSESLPGVVTDYSEHFVYLSLIADSGQPNGIAVCWRDDVTRIRWGGNERQSLAELAAAAAAKPTAPSLKIDSLPSVIESVSARFGYVNVLAERLDSNITFIGEVVELDAQAIVLKTFGTFASRDRSHLLLNLGEITRVDADADYERSVAFLAKQTG